MLRVENPAWATASPYAKGQMKQHLLFYHLNQQHREVSVPRNFPLHLLSPEIEIKDDTSRGERVNFKFAPAFKLRPYQWKFVEQQVGPALTGGHTDLHFGVPCGQGKTVLSLYMAVTYGRRTLVLVTTHALAQQFARSAAWVTPEATVEVLESGKNWKLDADIRLPRTRCFPMRRSSPTSSTCNSATWCATSGTKPVPALTTPY